MKNKILVIVFCLFSVAFGLGLGFFLLNNPSRCKEIALKSSSLYEPSLSQGLEVEVLGVKYENFLPRFNYLIKKSESSHSKLTLSSLKCEKIHEEVIETP